MGLDLPQTSRARGHYSPFALVLDHYHGWVPPVHKAIGQSKPEHVWGNIPYTLGDFQIDQFFRWVFPDYQMYAFTMEGRGCLTPTPYGDNFDVLLTNTPAHALGKYQAAIFLGDIHGDSDFESRVVSFVESGGTVILCCDQMHGRIAELAGVKVVRKGRKSSASNSLLSGKTYHEGEYAYDLVTLEGGAVLATTEDGAPLICINQVGAGFILTITACYWGHGHRPNYQWHTIEGLPFDQNYKQDLFQGRPQPPIEILKAVQEVIGEVMESYDLLEVSGMPIRYAVNVTEDRSELIITLVNNTDSTWTGTIAVKGQEIEKVEEWLSMGEAVIRNGALHASVPANDVRILEINCAEQFLDLAL